MQVYLYQYTKYTSNTYIESAYKYIVSACWSE